MPLYLRPERCEDALHALAGGDFHILAGGTDFYPARVGQPVDDNILDIGRIAELRCLAETANGWRLGASVTWGEIIRAPLPAWMGVLQQAAREVGGPQIQNTGSLGGNLCNASPAADGVPALLALDASVELHSLAGRRILPLREFLLGSRRTALRPGELLVAILIPAPRLHARSVFLKLGARRYLVISIVMVAVLLELDDTGRIRRAAIAVGACSPVARRLHSLETALCGQRPEEAVPRVTTDYFKELAPLTDVRADADYRIESARRLVCEALMGLAA